MDERSSEIASDDLPTVQPGNETNSSEILDTGRHQKKSEGIPREEACGVKSDHPTGQGRTEQTDRLAVKRTVDKRFACSDCDYRAASKANLLIHSRRHAEMDERSSEIALDDLPPVPTWNAASSSETMDTGRQQDKGEETPSEEPCGAKSDHPSAQSRTEQTDRLEKARTRKKTREGSRIKNEDI
ncbi:Hypp4907 [Branchiostoma lanceolatum]|uniref:Hypp4907 protein n=1 Tax=Branchiostoma lanceolatum TaxID=7740 RepID=A0A8K0F335_BRALA|nr:Hypp4907 [Branchiostoma lanceolatum]